MSQFKEAPVLVLETLEDVRTFIQKPRNELKHLVSDQFRIKSLWLIALIDEIVAIGKYPYNADVALLADERLGNPVKPYTEYSRDGTTLSLLVYNAQCYRRSDQLYADGYVPFTESVLKTAYEQGKGIHLRSESVPLRVRNKSGKLYAMKPSMRKFHIAPQGQPVRLASVQ